MTKQHQPRSAKYIKSCHDRIVLGCSWKESLVEIIGNCFCKFETQCQPSGWNLGETCQIIIRVSVRTRDVNQGAQIVWKMFTFAHTALAIKACFLGGISYTKCSVTFVNIAVAISALAWGRWAKTTETRIRCFRHFSTILGCLSWRGYWHGIFGHFGRLPAMEKPARSEKTL